MKLSLPIINLDNQWLVMQGDNLREIDKPEDLSNTNLILTDFNDAVFGLETVSGPVEHASALIEKRLRDIGLLDGPSKIIVHNTRKVGDTATVLFTAIPAENYSEYFELVNKQKDHCLVIPLLSVLYKQINVDNDENYALVFHHNREFDLLIVKDQKIRKISRLTSFSTSDEDVSSTVETLAKEINEANLSVNKPLKSIKWMSLLGEKNDQKEFQEKVNQLTNIKVVEEKHSDITFNGKKYKTVLPKLLKNINSKDVANDSTSQMLYKSERLLPMISIVFATVLAIILFTLWNWNNQISDIQQQLSQSDRNKLNNDIASIKADLIQSNREFLNNKNAQITSQWLYNLDGIQSSPDPKQLVNDIGSALPYEVQVVGISLDARKSPATVILNGVIDKPLKLALKDLENMSTKLLNRGYKMESSSSIELSDNNDFRMTLKVDYNDK